MVSQCVSISDSRTRQGSAIVPDKLMPDCSTAVGQTSTAGLSNATFPIRQRDPIRDKSSQCPKCCIPHVQCLGSISQSDFHAHSSQSNSVARTAPRPSHVLLLCLITVFHHYECSGQNNFQQSFPAAFQQGCQCHPHYAKINCQWDTSMEFLKRWCIKCNSSVT